MPDRMLEDAIIGGSVLLALIATALSAAGFSDPAIGFANGELGPFLIGPAIIWIYAAYWAFDIRKALSTNLFRNQALGMGLVAIGWLLVNTVFNFTPTNPTETVQALAQLSAPVTALAFSFYWVDTSIFAAQRTDPLQRKTMRWREVRWLVWPSFGLLIALGLLAVLPSFLIVALFLIVATVLGAAFANSVLRSKDRTLKRHLEWFGLSFVGLAVTLLVTAFIVTSLGGIVSDATETPAFIVFAYFIYRSAKSLAPLERMDRPARGEAAHIF